MSLELGLTGLGSWVWAFEVYVLFFVHWGVLSLLLFSPGSTLIISASWFGLSGPVTVVRFWFVVSFINLLGWGASR